MALIDSSAWIAYLRGAEGEVRVAVRKELAAGSAESCGIIDLEVLAGARNEANLGQLEEMLSLAQNHRVEEGDFATAAEIFRTCRGVGVTIRSLNDCIIASIALRTRSEILHDDRDFDRLAQVVGVRARRS